MNPVDLVDRTLAISDQDQRRLFLETHREKLNDQTARIFKERADAFLRSEIKRSLAASDGLLFQAELTRNPKHRALGLLAKANALSIGESRYEDAIDLYDEAARIYKREGLIVEQARSQVGKVGALALLDRYDEAEKIGLRASEILEQHDQLQPLATLTMNLASMYSYRGLDAKALKYFDRAADLYARLGAEGEQGRTWVEHNRAVILRNLGAFEASIQTSRAAYRRLVRMGQTIAAAKAKQNLAMTHFALGQYNKALRYLDEVRDAFRRDQRERDAILVELFISDCLLQLRRFGQVLEKCREVRHHFSALGTRRFVGQAILNEAVALNHLGRHSEALDSLNEARSIFEQESNPALLCMIDLEIAGAELQADHPERCFSLALECAQTFHSLNLRVEFAQSKLVAAKAALAGGKKNAAEKLLREVMGLESGLSVPSLSYQAQHLFGRLEAQRGNLKLAIDHLDRAIRKLEQVSGHLMLEYRAGFIEDKAVVYEDAVKLCLDSNDPSAALQYAERAKSRALLDLLAYRLDLSVHARSEEDRPLVKQLNQLRSERDRLYRRWESDEEARENAAISPKDLLIDAQRKIISLDEQITELWHRLLVRNADYANEAALWTIRTEPVQQYLDPETLLIEYYVLDQKPLVFLVSSDEIRVRYLDADMRQVQRGLQLLQLNLNAVPRSSPRQVPHLTANAQALLGRLYDLLLRPICGDVAPFENLLIVPHGILHYVPFQALFDGRQYTAIRHQISYLPSASVLRHCLEAHPSGDGMAAFAFSSEGRIPNVVEEARSVAARMGGEAFVESQATKDQLSKSGERSGILHLAAHGHFRSDNPLFSGVALADGWLSTLDIFSMKLQASLVALSACQTGRSVIGGGDELLGLSRALLSAGAPSLLLSLWTVEDRATTTLMMRFYENLDQGKTKAASLSDAQRSFIQRRSVLDTEVPEAYAHPYYWAPFFLVGDPGPLARKSESVSTERARAT